MRNGRRERPRGSLAKRAVYQGVVWSGKGGRGRGEREKGGGGLDR